MQSCRKAWRQLGGVFALFVRIFSTRDDRKMNRKTKTNVGGQELSRFPIRSGSQLYPSQFASEVDCRFLMGTAFIFPSALVNYQNEDGVINSIKR